MTRRSKRELKRALDELGVPEDSAPDSSDLTDRQQEAIRAVLRYRRGAYPNGGAPTWGDLVGEALEEIDSRHADALQALDSRDSRGPT